jgi:Type I phosphodiesterase / nucleotide pyrophosphatase
MSSHQGDDPRVDELRQRLRSLGYLDAGVDRFVLGPARATRRPSAIAFLASLRVGIIAALLLGPAAALGLSARLPGLVTGPRDAAVVALYLGGFFGAAMSAAAIAASLLVFWVSRQSGAGYSGGGRWLARGAGGLVTLLCLIYLTLWWQTVIAGLGWSAPIWTTSALLVAAAMSLLLGHAVVVASSAVLLAADNATESDGRRGESSSWRGTVASGAIAFAGAALLLTWSAEPRGGAAAREPLTVVPTGLRVRVIAIDGFDARIFDSLSASGRLPALTASLGRARVQLESRPGDTGDPARVWTTIATGQPPDVHGVQGLETRRLAGVHGSVAIAQPSPLGRAIRGATDLVRLTSPAIASGSERRAKTFWEVAAEAGLRTVVVNWWATWPVPEEAGIVLSDRVTLRLERNGPLDAELAPASLYETLRQRWPEIKARASADATTALELSSDDTTRRILLRSAELDAIQIALVSAVAPPAADLSVIYLPGLDIAQYALLFDGPAGLSDGQPGLSDGQARLSPSALAARLEGLQAYYSALDRLLAPLLRPGPGELVMLVTEPGRVGDGRAMMSVNGPAARSHQGGVSQATAAAPTVLYALGVPVSRDLPSAPLLELFDPGFAARYPPRFVSTYGRPSAAPAIRSGQPLDQEMIDRLRSLGYVR